MYIYMYIFDISTINIHKPTSSSYTKPALLTKKTSRDPVTSG